MAVLTDNLMSNGMTLNPSEPAFGIDLGTTNSAIGYFFNGRVEILKNLAGERTTPSYVSYSSNPPIVGKMAQKEMKMNRRLVAYDAKRMIGLNFDDSAVQQNKDFWVFQLEKNTNNRPVYNMGKNLQILPKQISAEVLKEMKKIAMDHLHEELKEFKAVVTVPAYFNQNQKSETLEAAQLAGIEVLSLITEPTAAAYAYGYDHNRFDNYTILVFDFGGGTCDVSIVKVHDCDFEVIGHAGDNQLGGRDFDNLLMNHYAKQIRADINLDVFDENNLNLKIRLRELCEKIKIELSFADEVRVELENVSTKLNYQLISYDFFKRLMAELIGRCQSLCEKCLKDSNISKDDIDQILLVGGSCRMRIVKEMLKQMFPNKDLKESINPDEAVAYGATIRAAQLLDPKNAERQIIFDKLPIGIGVALIEDRYEICLKRNTPIPSTPITKKFITVYKDQISMLFEIFEGERVIASKNTCIGQFTLAVPPLPAGAVMATLTMQLNKNGILECTAKYNNQTEKLELNPNKNLTGESIQEMLNALETNRQTDKAQAEANRARSVLRQNIEFIKSALDRGKVSSEDKANLMKKIEEIDKWLISTKQELTPEIRNKFESIEEDAKKLLITYHKIE